MTLNDFFQFAGEHHAQVIFYFTILPFAALLAGMMEREEGHLPPWNYLYTSLLYLTAVPAILSVGLTAYRWLFERTSIMEADLVLQFLPAISFLVTALLIKRQVNMRALPGFGRLGGLVIMIAATLMILWFVDRTRIIVFSYLKIQYLLLIFLALLVLIRLGWRRIMA